MTKKQRILAGVGIATLLAGGFVFAIWRKMPHNQLDVQGPFRSEVVVLPRDRALGKPIIDLKLPIVGRFALPTPVVVTPDDMALLKGDDNVGGLLRLRTGGTFDQSAYRLGGDTFWASAWSTPNQMAVPYAFGDRPLQAIFRWAGPKPTKVELTLPALYRPAPSIPEVRLETGQFTVVLTPITPKTTLPFVDYTIRVEGNTRGRQLAASLGGTTAWIRILQNGSRIRIGAGENYISLSLATLEDVAAKIVRGPDGPGGEMRIRDEHGRMLFQIYERQILQGWEWIAFTCDNGRLTVGDVQDDATSESPWSGRLAPPQVYRLPKGKPFDSVLYRLGPMQTYQLETHIPKHAFMKSF